MGEQMELPARVWQRLNLAWIAFFALMGVLNLYVAYSYPTATWVNFKLFGGIGLMLLFTLAQGLYLSRHMKPTPTTRRRRVQCGHEPSTAADIETRAAPARCSPPRLEVQRRQPPACRPRRRARRPPFHVAHRQRGASPACRGWRAIASYMMPLRPLIPRGIHALAIDARAPGES